MSSYPTYCQDQARDCARRARLASSPEMVAYCRTLKFRWLTLAEQAQETGGALGHESGLAATMFPLRDKPAPYPVEYAKRAGELIARSASMVGLPVCECVHIDRPQCSGADRELPDPAIV
jgi:hypothetical protein